MSQKMSKLFNCILLCLALASTVFLTACSDGGSTDADYYDASLYGTWEEVSEVSGRRPTVSFLWNGEVIQSRDGSGDEWEGGSVPASIKKSNVAKEAEKVYGEPDFGEWFCNKGKLKIKYKDEDEDKEVIDDAEYRVEGKTLSITFDDDGETVSYKKISNDSSNKSDVVGKWYLHPVDGDDGQWGNDVLTVNSDGSFVYKSCDPEDSSLCKEETGTWEYNRGMLRMKRQSDIVVFTLIDSKLNDTHSENVAVFGREVYIPGAIR